MNHPMRTLLSLAGMLLVNPAVAETFRCGQWIASPDMSIEELLEKCGEPSGKTVEEIEIYGPAVSGAGRVKRGTSTVEKWTYERGNQLFAMVVTIVDGEIKGIDRAE